MLNDPSICLGHSSLLAAAFKHHNNVTEGSDSGTCRESDLNLVYRLMSTLTMPVVYYLHMSFIQDQKHACFLI